MHIDTIDFEKILALHNGVFLLWHELFIAHIWFSFLKVLEMGGEWKTFNLGIGEPPMKAGLPLYVELAKNVMILWHF